MKIFVDDKRDFSEVQLCGYNCVRTYKQCITLLSVFKDIDAIMVLRQEKGLIK